MKKYDINKNRSSAFKKIAELPQKLFEQTILKEKELTTAKMLLAVKQYELDKIRNDESEKLQKQQK